MADPNPADLPIAGLLAAFRDRQVSPVEVLDTFVQRIDALDDRLHAFVVVNRDEAYAQARAAERAYRDGEAGAPLLGVPISVKDAFHMRGLPTTVGSVVGRNVVARSDSGVARRLRSAGAVFVGKTNTAEFGQSATSENRLGPDTVNAWGVGLTPGGSSGGAATSVAAGMAAAAIGSDGGGSIRIPAAFSGIVGMKPTYGLVSDEKGFRGMTDFTVAGPMTRTVDDSRRVLEVLADRGLDHPSPCRLRVGYCARPEGRPVDPGVDRAVRAAADAMAAAGHRVVPTDLAVGGWDEVFGPLVLDDENRERGHLLDLCPDVLSDYELASLRAAADLDPAAVARAEDLLPRYRARVADLFDEFDLLLTPTVAAPAFPLGRRPRVIDGHRVGWLWGAFPFAVPYNVAGVPAISVPCGLADGLPVGAQLVGPRGADGLVLAVGEGLESELGLGVLRPDCYPQPVA